jgi:hypothetical protein
MITRALLILVAAACPALAQTGITVMADSNRAVRTNFTLGNAQVTGLAALLDAKLATNGNASALTNLTGGNVVGAVATASNIAGILAISNGGTGATTASNARTALGLGTAATNAATAFQAANTNLTALASGDGSSLTNITPVTDASSLTNFPAELLRTNGDGSALTGITVDLTTVLPAYTNNAAKVLAVATNETGVEWIAISNTVTDAATLTNFPTLNQNTTGTASNVTGVVAIANGGTGATNAANARVTLLPSYSANASKVLALNTNATDVEWITITNGGGTSGVTSVDVSGGSTGLTTSGGPITTNGTITLGGTLSLASGGTGATNASGARTALELGTAATNAATAFQLASTNLDTLANNNGANLTNIPISNTVTDASALTNFPTLNQNTTGTASNVTGVVAIVNGGTGQTNAAASIAALLPSYTANGGKVLGLDTNLALTWTTNAGGGGGGLPETPLAISNGGSGASDVVGVLSNFNLVRGSSVTLGTAVTNAGTHSVSVGSNATTPAQDAIAIGRDALVSSNNGIAIGYSALATTNNGTVSDGVAIGYDAWAERGVSIGRGSQATSTGSTTNFYGIAIGNNSYATENGIAIGWDAIGNNGIAIGVLSYIGEPNAIAIGTEAEADATNAIQIGNGTNTTANTVQFRSAGSVTTNSWTALANSTAFGHYVMAAPTNGTANQVLALNSNATAVVWTTNAGGGGTVDLSTTNATGVLPLTKGGTGGTNAASAISQLGLTTAYGGGQVGGNVAGSRGGAVGNDAALTNLASTEGGGAIGYQSRASTGLGGGQNARALSGAAIGLNANSQGAGGAALGRGANTTNGNGGAVGRDSQATDGFAGGYLAKSLASTNVQLGTGTNTNANTIQFLTAGTVGTTQWGYLASASTKGGSRMTNTDGVTATNTIIGYDGTNYTTNTITVLDGIITSWTQ